MSCSFAGTGSRTACVRSAWSDADNEATPRFADLDLLDRAHTHVRCPRDTDVRCPRERFEKLAGKIFAGIGFRVSDKLLKRVSRHRRMDSDTERIGCEARNRIEISHRIVKRPALK